MKSDNSYWGVMSGTSMAAPTVAGIIALWLQADPNLTVAQVKSIIAGSANRDRFTNGAHRDQFGPNGKINALEGLMIVLKNIKDHDGDVNNDGMVDIVDVTALINYLLKGEADGINLGAADVNDNGHVEISDLSALITLLLFIEN
jgi:hypothetical protein